MIKKALVLSTISLSLLSASVFAQTLATVNGKAIPQAYSDIVYQKEFASRGVDDSPQLRQNIKQVLIGREVVVQEAEKQKLGDTPEGQKQLKFNKREALIATLHNSYLKKNPVTDQEIKAAYDTLVQNNSKQYHIKLIVAKDEADAKSILAQLNKGGNFEKLAKEKSIQKETAKNGGDLGWLPIGSFEKQLKDSILSLKNGQTTKTPLKTPGGYYIIKLVDSKTVSMPTLEQIKPRLKFQLEEKKWSDYVGSLVKAAKIQ